jgi:membrane protein CcdC involved in cytochrome C biogenesis
LIQKKQKIKPEYFCTKNHRTNFSIATPAARVSHSTRGSLPAANAKILTVIFLVQKYKGDYRSTDFYLKTIFSFVLIQKKQKIKPQYFYPKNHQTYFPIATPAARVSHSTWGSLPAASAEILTVIFLVQKYKGDYRSTDFYLKTIFSFVLITHGLIIYWSS